MTTPTWTIRRSPAVSDAEIEGLADVLLDCVEGGASVSFMHPLTRERAVAFWRGVALGVAAGQRALLVAEDALGICGCVQLVFDLPENQPHRADLSKMLVHRRSRRQGLAAALMRSAEDTARECGRTLLVLDAVTDGDAARLYTRLGWVRVGDIPDFALFPQGGLCSTTVFYRHLGQGAPAPVSAARPAISFRLLAPAEFEAIRPLWEQLNQHHASYPTPFAAEIAARSFAARLGALRDKSADERLRVEIAANSPDSPPIAYGVTSLSSSGVGEVDSLFVAPEYRRLGIASTLLQNALDWLRAHGAVSPRVVVFQANDEAVAFYRRFGFHPRNLELERPASSS